MKKTFNTNRIIQVALLFILISFQANAQKNLKKYLLTGSSQFVSGMLDGTIESISYHYERGFKARVPNANDNFWNPELSWKNKYKNGDCNAGPKFSGSTTILVSTTDAYHLLRTGKRAVDGLTLAYYINKECSGGSGKDFTDKKKAKKKWKGIAKDFLVLTAIRCAGFHLTYSMIFKQQQNFQYK